MNRTSRLRLLIIAFVMTAALADCSAAQTPRYSRQEAVAKVTNVLASSFDGRLPHEPFGGWVSNTLSVKRIDWTVHVGCGEPHNARPNDVCVGALIPFDQEYVIGIVIHVGTISRLDEHATVNLLFRERNDGSKYDQFDSLSDLATFAQETLGPRRQ